MEINPEIFKAYDIRGIYPVQINEKVFYKIAQAFYRLTKAKEIIVGRDNRVFSESLKESLIAGLCSQGVKVIDIGLCSTPAFYFAVCHLNVSAGMMISASHLEKQYNGIKGVFKNAIPLKRSDIIEWKRIALKEKIPSLSRAKKIIKKDIKAEYVVEIRKHVQFPIKRFKVVMDAGNAMAGLYLKEIFKGTPLKIFPLFWELDGNFPNRGLDPRKKENRKKIAEKVRESKSDLGFLWDGDGDRFFALDAKGQAIDPNFVSTLIAKCLVRESSRKKVIVDIRTSRVVKDKIESLGGKVLVTKAWHPEIKFAMKENPEAIFGSETSGHFIFKNFYCIDDGILASIYFLKALSAEKKKLDEILKELKSRYFIIEEKNFPIPNMKRALEILINLGKYYQKKKGKISKIDGLSVKFPDWRFNLRPSETEPLLRLNLEANSKTLMEEKEKEVAELIERS